MEPQSHSEELIQPGETLPPAEPTMLIEPAAEASPPEQDREPLARKVTPEKRKREVNLLAINILERKMRSIETSLAENPGQESQLPPDPGSRQINSLRILQDAKAGTYNADLAVGNPLTISYRGESYQATRLLGATDTQFTVELLSPDKKTRIPAATVPRSDITTAQLLAEASVILSALSQPEQKLLGLYIQDQKTALSNEAYSEELDATIAELGVAAGIPTVMDVDAFLATQNQSSPETAQTVTAIRADLATKNILDYATTMSILDRLGCNPTALGEKVQKSQAELTNQQAILEANPQDEAAKGAVEMLTIQIDTLTKVIQSLNGDSAIREFFQNVELGKADVSKAQEMSAALRSGDMITLIATLAPELAVNPDDTPEQAADKENKRKELAGNIAAMGAIGIGSVLVLLWQLAVTETKTMQKAIK